MRGELRKNLLARLRRLQRLYLDTCVRCGLCSLRCPAYEVSQDIRAAPSYRMKLVSTTSRALLSGRAGAEELLASAYSCALCGRCEESCPFSIDAPSLWLSLREAIHKSGLGYGPLRELEGAILKFKNPYGVEPDMRSYWAEMVGLEEVARRARGKRADVLLFAGCTPSLRSAGQDVLASTVRLLERARESWALLDEEWCCGGPLVLLGSSEAAAEFAGHNVKAIEAAAPKYVTTVCPTCYKMFRFEYPALLNRPMRFRAVHVTELLAKYFIELRLEAPAKLDLRVAYHDPCDLARASGVTEAPRILVREVAKELIELPGNKLDTYCCGGGGLLQAVNNELRLKIARRRLRMAVEAGADALASACPTCKASLAEAAREEGLSIEVLDVVELVARALGLA